MTFGLGGSTAIIVQTTNRCTLYHVNPRQKLLKTVDCKSDGGAKCIYIKCKKTFKKNDAGVWKDCCHEDVHKFVTHYINDVAIRIKGYSCDDGDQQLGVRIEDGDFVVVGM